VTEKKIVKSITGIGLAEVTSLYGSVQGDFLQLIFGQQIHIGGMKASIELAEVAGIRVGLNGIDLCCCNGAGMRFLVRSRKVASMVGVDATETIVKRGRRITQEEGLDDRVRFVLADACQSGLPSASADFVWSEDAWCYVTDKTRLIAEAARIVRPGGVIAFTDWVEGSAGLTDSEAQRFLGMMTLILRGAERMRPRHAAALDLVSWYLMTPPVRPDGSVNVAAPLSKWKTSNTYDARRRIAAGA